MKHGRFTRGRPTAVWTTCGRARGRHERVEVRVQNEGARSSRLRQCGTVAGVHGGRLQAVDAENGQRLRNDVHVRVSALRRKQRGRRAAAVHTLTFVPNFTFHQEIAVPTNRGKYNLYAYTEGQTMEKIKSMKFYGTPVVFIPGHSGSYRQGTNEIRLVAPPPAG